MQSGAGQLRHLLWAALTILASAAPLFAEPALREAANITWREDAPWFGGFSAIEVSEDGRKATFLTDRGSLVEAALLRDADTLTGLRLIRRQPLRNLSGAELRGFERDAEGLAIAADGSAFASYEFRDHAARLDLETGRNSQLRRYKDFFEFRKNEGLEALAIHPDGTLYAFSERPGDRSGTVPVYAYRDGIWRISHRLPASLGHVPVGADFDAAGRLFLLERLVTPLGFSSRIRMIALTPDGGRARTLLTTVPGTHGNLEGISVWSDSTGATRLTLVADDNFLAVLSTQIVEYLLTE